MTPQRWADFLAGALALAMLVPAWVLLAGVARRNAARRRVGWWWPW